MFFLRKKKPLLSVVVIGWQMPRQLANTVYSLSGAYQRDADPSDWEIILVENRSHHLADRRLLARIAPNLRYFLRNEKLSTPVNAINFGAAKARGEFLAIMIDGARMVTPGVINHTLQCFRAAPRAVVGMPGYHLGDSLQQESSLAGYDEAREGELLASVDWRHDGYRLFDIACPGKSSERGPFSPLPESNWLALPRELFFCLGGYDRRFDSHGGGYANHDMWRRACEAEGVETFVLAGEGSFHQYHGGATTDARGKDMRRLLDQLHAQYRSIRGRDFAPPTGRATVLGKVPYEAIPALGKAAGKYVGEHA